MAVDMLGDGLTVLTTQRKAFMGTAVTYYRGASSVAVTATPGRTVFRYGNEVGALIREVSTDFIIDVADLVIDGVTVEPARGDQVWQVADGVTYKYGVMSFGGEPAWRWTDGHRRAWRIHTKLVGTA